MKITILKSSKYLKFHKFTIGFPIQKIKISRISWKSWKIWYLLTPGNFLTMIFYQKTSFFPMIKLKHNFERNAFHTPLNLLSPARCATPWKNQHYTCLLHGYLTWSWDHVLFISDEKPTYFIARNVTISLSVPLNIKRPLIFNYMYSTVLFL